VKRKKKIDGWNYSIEVKGHKVLGDRHDGTKESYGGWSMFAGRFLSSNRKKDLVEEIFGARVLARIVKAAEAAAKLGYPESTKFAHGTSCPFCGGQLRTVRAKQCPHCFESWRDQ